jgi:hypothetical protein
MQGGEGIRRQLNVVMQQHMQWNYRTSSMWLSGCG